MTSDNFESDAELVKNQGDTAPEGAEGRAGPSPDGAPPADPVGGDTAADEAESAEGEPADAPAGEPAEAPGSESVAEEGEELASADAAPPAGTGEGGEASALAVAASPPLDPQEKKRRRLLAGLAALIVLLVIATVVIIRYLAGPQPLPDLLPLPVDINYRPHYLFSIYGVDRPVGVAVSPDGERIYVTETGRGSLDSSLA